MANNTILQEQSDLICTVSSNLSVPIFRNFMVNCVIYFFNDVFVFINAYLSEFFGKLLKGKEKTEILIPIIA